MFLGNCMISVLSQIDRLSPRSLREQIVAAYAQAIRDGRLESGAALPSVRALAGRLGVSPLTVAGAYRELCACGLAISLPRSGFRVRPNVTSAQPLRQVTQATQVISPTPAAPRARFALDRLEPDLRLHPVAELARLIGEVGATDASLGAYGDFHGDAQLRQAIAEFDAAMGVACDAGDGLLITSGAQQAIALYARTLAPGLRVAVEDPCYPGARLAFAAVGAQLVGVRLGDDGPDAASLRAIATPGAVAAFYCCPTYANPGGRSWSEAARHRVLAAAQQGGFVVVEDDYLGDLDYLDEAPTRLATLASSYSGVRVVRIRTFSKALLPALRLASVAADGELIGRLRGLKIADDLGCSALLQRALAEFIRRGDYAAHLERVRPRYRAVRAELRATLAAGIAGLSFDDPPAGWCLLGRVEAGVDLGRFVAECARLGVSVAPAADYWIDRRDGDGSFRIAFANLAPGEVAQVVALLARAALAAGTPPVDRSLI